MKFDDAQDLVKPDIHSSSEEYTRRFSGKVGHWFLEVQQTATQILLENITGNHNIIDFGGGHGQNYWLAADNSNSYTVHASDECCLEHINLDHTQVKQVIGGLVNSGLDSRSFNIAMSYRMLAHLQDWQGHIAELCRVSNNHVIIEFPNAKSVNAFAENLFSMKKSVEGNTRQFALFQLKQLQDEFAKHGFTLEQTQGQYLWPMALHRALKIKALSRALEGLAALIIPKKRFGSPLICHFQRHTEKEN